ncbi:MAG: HAMP domain-containing histidine kinase [Coriobacteriia bacterium]|nr:HAMP domain-containing histidine kinase [Coriobacteriia bacterium]
MSDAGARGSRPRPSTASRARAYVVGGTLLSLVVAFGVFAAVWSQYAIGRRTDDLARQVAVLAKGQAAAEQLDEAVSATTRDRMLRIEAGLIGAALVVTDDSGKVLRSTAGTSAAPLPLGRLKPTQVADVSAARLRTGAGVPVVMVATPMDGGHVLVAIQGLAEIGRAQTGLLALAGLSLVVAAVVAFVAGGVLARRLTAPLVRLESAADHVAAGELGTQVAEEGDAETASLARSFNRMSSRVADAYAAQKAFVGDVSHEIRTPLTSIRGFAQALLDGVVSEPDKRTHALEVIRDEADRIAEMSSTLLALAELDAGSVRLACTPVDVATVRDALAGRFVATADDAGVTLALELDDNARPLGDVDRVVQVVSAIVGNAIGHTPSGGTVRVRAVAEGGAWVVRVADSGPGVPVADRARIFERFARLDSSRTSSSGGAGLGLSIASRFVELMGGTISVGDSDLGGAEFAVTLPLARS